MSETGTLRHSLTWAFARSWGQRGIATFFTFALAAILGPYDFGVVAMALVYIALVELVLEQGVATTIIQRKELAPEHLDSAFWLNIVCCLVLAAASVAVSGWWASVNNVPELERVIDVLSLILVIEGLAIVQQALLQRRLEFKKLAVRWNLAALVGGSVGISLAIAGAGVWALVGQQLGMQASALVLLWFVSDWRPRLRFSRRHARQLLGFSADVFVANVGAFVWRRADVLLMGLFFTPIAVGLYRLADRIVDIALELTAQPVGTISLPHLSRAQDDPEGLRRSVASCIRMTLLTTVPTMFILGACSYYILDLIGSEWTSADDALMFLALIGIGKALVILTGPLLFAVARPRLRAVIIWSLAALSAGTVVAAASALRDKSVADQILGVSVVRAVLFALVFVPVNLLILRRFSGLPLTSLLPWLTTPVGAGLAGAGAVLALEAAGVLARLQAFPALLLAGGSAVLAAGAVLVVRERAIRREAVLLLRRAGA
jgi:PST family polysaccharide transporter